MEQAEYGIDLLFFDEPGEDATAFGSAVHERLGQWQAADEATGIAAVGHGSLLSFQPIKCRYKTDSAC
jgi:hypothetical protein